MLLAQGKKFVRDHVVLFKWRKRAWKYLYYTILAILILSEIIGLSYQVAFQAYGSLNAREYIVNLIGVAVSSVCYYTSVPNECSSFTPGSVSGIPDLNWLATLMYDRGESWQYRAYYASSRSKIAVETRLFQVS